MMSTGVSSSYSNQQNLGFSVSSSNYLNRRSLSLVPSFNATERRTISYVRNYHFSYSARLLAMRKIARARLISAFFARRRMVINQEEAMYTRSGSSFSSQINLNNNSHQRRTRVTITELDEEACSDENKTRTNNNGAPAPALDPTPVSVYHPSRINDDNGDDGITHSLPYKKYGPYTCPRCLGKFLTSQKFAAHVSSHYKYETKAQRRRRLMAKIRRRNLRLHHSREGITLLPTEPVAQPEPVNMTEAEATGDDGALSLVQIKEEPAEF
ncbi:hypothetical protein K1719_013975 [Acacia pycnantha]|nr:hypothetical protein K1719_013975 [Acacia pycnantha]